MMCPRCEKNNKENATYCPYCGLNFTDSEMAATLHSKKAEQSSYQTIIQEGMLARQVHSNQEVGTDEEEESLIRSYGKFLWESLKKPFEMTKEMGAEHLLFSYLNLLLVTFFSSLLITLLSRPYPLYGVNLENMVTLAKAFFSSFISYGLILLITVSLIFVFLKYICQIKLNFNEVMIKFGIHQAIPLLFIFVCLILALFPLITLQTLLIRLFNLIQIIVIYVIFNSYQRKAKKKLVPIYATLSVWAILLVLSMVLLNNYTILGYL